MTEIGMFWPSYLQLPKLIFVDDQFTPHTLTNMRMGVYDPDWGVFDESYTSGKFVNGIGEPYVDDTRYNEAPGMVTTFKHSWFGNTWAKNIGSAHFHVTHIVSSNTIRPQDVNILTENGDIMFFANILHNPPHAITQVDGTDEMLIEIEPFLSPSDLEKLAKDGKFVHKIKEMYMKMESKVFTLESDLFIKTSEAASAQITVLQLQESHNDLFQYTRLTLDKVLKLKLSSGEAVLNGIEMVEGKHNFGIPMGIHNFESADKTAAMLQDNIRMINARMKLNGENDMPETQAWILFNQVASIIGRDRMMRFFNGTQQHIISTPLGSQRISVSDNPSLTEMLLLKAQQVNSGSLSTEEFQEALLEATRAQNQSIKTSPTINGAVEQMKTNLLNPQAQEAHGGNGNN